MTKEEAIKWLENLESDIGKMQFRTLWDYKQAIDEIIKLLSADPSDLVSRKTLIGAIEKCGEEKIYPQALVKTINALPSAVCDDCIWRVCNYNSVDWEKPNTNKPQGEWIKHKGEWKDFDFYPTKYECNQCHYCVDEGYDSIFCPNCGARMKGGDTE